VTSGSPTGHERVVTLQFGLLWIGSFALFLSFFLLMPTLPRYARALGIPESHIGLLSGAFPLAAMLVRPLAGWAADRHGRKPLMLLGALVFAVSGVLYAMSHTLAALVAVRALHGTGMGLYPTAGTAMAADMAPAARRGYALGLIGIAASLALAIGPLAGLWLADARGYGWLFGVSALLALIALGLSVGQRESLRAPVRVRLAWNTAFSRPVLYPCAIVLCLMATYGVQVTYLPLRVAGGRGAGVFFTAMAVIVILSRWAAGGLSDRVGRPPVAAAGALCSAAALGVIVPASDAVSLALAGGLYGLGFGLTQPSLIAWCVDLVSPTERGRAMGTFYTALELGIATGAIGAGWVLAHTGYEAVFLMSAGIALAATVLALARATRSR
jgi:predicted MFS family arabinose efflux permease